MDFILVFRQMSTEMLAGSVDCAPLEVDRLSIYHLYIPVNRSPNRLHRLVGERSLTNQSPIELEWRKLFRMSNNH